MGLFTRSKGAPPAAPPPAAAESAAQTARGGIPNVIVAVLPGNTVNHGGHHGPGDTFEVEGLTAVALAQQGHVQIVGSTR